MCFFQAGKINLNCEVSTGYILAHAIRHAPSASECVGPTSIRESHFRVTNYLWSRRAEHGRIDWTSRMSPPIRFEGNTTNQIL